LKKNLSPKNKLESIYADTKNHIDESSERALVAEDPNPTDATTYVYSTMNEPAFKEVVFDDTCQELVIVDAINKALKEEMSKDEKILVFGEDVALGKGGVFTATRGLSEEFGIDRCFNSPLAEASIIGVAIGYALRGFVPVVEIQFADYIWTAMMQIRNELCTIRYRSNNDFSSKVIIRVPVGGYIHGGLCHSQNIEATFAHIPGIKIAMPSNALDAYGLLKSAINGDDPVLFLEHKGLYRQNFAKSKIPNDSNFLLPFG
jgi:2-oxoisovalerate dehydrogenase E1 component